MERKPFLVDNVSTIFVAYCSLISNKLCWECLFSDKMKHKPSRAWRRYTFCTSTFVFARQLFIESIHNMVIYELCVTRLRTPGQLYYNQCQKFVLNSIPLSCSLMLDHTHAMNACLQFFFNNIEITFLHITSNTYCSDVLSQIVAIYIRYRNVELRSTMKQFQFC